MRPMASVVLPDTMVAFGPIWTFAIKIACHSVVTIVIVAVIIITFIIIVIIIIIIIVITTIKYQFH